jgi:hypothetical protein
LIRSILGLIGIRCLIVLVHWTLRNKISISWLWSRLLLMIVSCSIVIGKILRVVLVHFGWGFLKEVFHKLL